MTKNLRRLACVCLTAVMGASLITSHALALANGKDKLESGVKNVNYENVTGTMDLSSIVLNNLSPSVLANAGLSSVDLSKTADYTVIVELDEKSVLEVTEDKVSVTDYLSTYAGKNTLGKINNSQKSLLSSLKSAGIKYTLKRSFSTVMNAVAITVDYSSLQKLNKISGVKSVVLSSSYEYPKAVETQDITIATNDSNIYGTGIYNSEKTIEKYGVDGSGVAVAILDTGLDYTHEAFTKYLPQTVRYTKSDIAQKINNAKTSDDVKFMAQEKSGTTVTADDVYVSAKVPFAYDYADDDADVYPSYSNHGTHVAGIVAGQADSYKNKDGHIEVDGEGHEIPFRGVAPNAQLVICKVFTDDFSSKDLGGAVTEDILAALDDCVSLGVDVINMSLGSSAGFSSICIKNDEYGLNDTEGQQMNEVYNRIKNAGISLVCAASNDFSSGYGSAFGTNLASNPDSGTIGSPSTFDGAMSVASINGQLARYMTVDLNGTETPIYYLESSDENSVSYDFLKSMLEKYGNGSTNIRAKYVLVPGRGEAADYTSRIQNLLKDDSEGPVIAVIRRGRTTFQDKIRLAMDMGADAAILANNVAGSIRMSLGDIEDPIPTVSVTMDAGTVLDSAATNGVGYINISADNQAGPFMNDYSSWGTTSDLKLKPDVTAHGGEITSTVPGGYAEQSGTSMASPNFAGFVALFRSYLLREQPGLAENPKALTRLINQITMSTATIVNDYDILPYSPRKQGSGLATLANVFTTKAYLSTIEGQEYGTEDNRPKIELGDDKDKNGEYTFSFYVNNFGTEPLEFELGYKFMTETLSSDGLSVAERAHMLTDNDAKWTVNGQTKNTGDAITVPANTTGETYKITVTVSLSAAEKQYIERSFVNGMFVEGFITLNSKTSGQEDGQCNLSLPFMGFYGDWTAAPMLDYDCFEISKFKQDTSYINDEDRPQAQVWATQAYAEYYNAKYSVPLGGFMYNQNEHADQIYTTEEYSAVSCYNEYIDAESTQNYLTTTSIKALYAGLLRNAEVVSYVLSDAVTGEVLLKDYKYRVSKAYANGGSAVPANVELNLNPSELGLLNNGKYKLDFAFYFHADEVGKDVKDENTFSMTFYVDYEAPVLESAKIRYYDYKDNNKDKQRIYLDLAVYDNHYAQSVILCYADTQDDETKLILATEYVTPVYNAVKNGTSNVSIEITDIYEKYKNSLYIQLDDYALNHSVYLLKLDNTSSLPDAFEIKEGSEITIGVNESRKLSLNYEGDANISDFTWNSSNPLRVSVKNGEIFGVSAGTTNVTVSNGRISRSIRVTVQASDITLPLPGISFGLIETAEEGLKNASGAVKVYAGKEFELEVVTDPWYYPVSNLQINWKTSNNDIASVTPNNAKGSTATVVTHGEEGSATITAVIVEDGKETLYATTVTLMVQDPFTVQSFVLTNYKGPGGTVRIPDDENITYIGEEAFKNDKTIKRVIIPKTVVEIRERAFAGCTNLEEIYFIKAPEDEGYSDDLETVIPDSNLSVINAYAFRGCTKLKLVDFTNVKVATLVYGAFANCTSLKTVKKMSALGTVNDMAFAGCTSLTEVDISGLHSAGSYVFSGCTKLESVKTDVYSSIGEGMFNGCIGLASVEIKTSYVGARAFYGCARLSSVTFGVNDITLGDQAFYGCALTSVTLPSGEVRLGDQTFPAGIKINGGENAAVYKGDMLIIAPSTINSAFAIKEGTTEISAYAFAGSRLADDVTSIVVPDSVKIIGEGAFTHLMMESITLPAGLKEIPDYLLYGCSRLNSVKIPDGVTAIGAGAFEGCIALQEITGFENNTNITSIGSHAFTKCENLKVVTLPANVKTMGDEVFAGCTELTEVHFPAITSLGAYTFGMAMQGGNVSSCSKLETVTFASEATTIGVNTFFPGAVYDENYVVRPLSSALRNVTLPESITEIPDSTFYYCSALESIDLKNVTRVGEYAFANCTSLATVKGLDKLTDIGAYAFSNCFAITELDLTDARNIGAYAFDMIDNNGSYTSIKLTKVENIGNYAFFGGKEATVNLPSTLKTFGYAVFTGSPNLTAVNISGSNLFKSEEGVLYRSVTNVFTNKTFTELMTYPAAKSGENYTVAEGTISIASYAFASLGGTLKSVTLPYSLQTIGAGAFVESGIEHYSFTSYNAPVLLSENLMNEVETDSLITNLQTYYTLYYRNFESAFANYSNIFERPAQSTLTITYPQNGVGYDNYVFARYFGTKTASAEVMEEDTYTFKTAMDDLLAEHGENILTKLNGWLTLEVSDLNTTMIENFSEQVKDAHRMYNNIKTESQLAILNEGKEGNYYYTLLASIEDALKSVKAKFGIAVKVESIKLDADSNYKTEYKEGEAFDATGIVIVVTYDDYSTQIITADQIKVISDYAGSLTELDKYVMIEYEGATYRVPVTVTAGGGDVTDGSSIGLIIGCVCGGVGLLAAAGAVVVIFLLRKKKANAETQVIEAEPQPEEEATVVKAESEGNENADKEENENKDEN